MYNSNSKTINLKNPIIPKIKLKKNINATKYSMGRSIITFSKIRNKINKGKKNIQDWTNKIL